MSLSVEKAVAEAFRHSWGRVIAAAYRVMGDLDRAEEAAAESFSAAVDDWSVRGLPGRSRRGWTPRLGAEPSTRCDGRWSSVGTWRRCASTVPSRSATWATGIPSSTSSASSPCSPGTGFGCGLSTEALAAMHHAPRPTMAARLTRAKQRLRDSVGAVDHDATVEPMLPVTIRAVYLVFAEGTEPGHR